MKCAHKFKITATANGVKYLRCAKCGKETKIITPPKTNKTMKKYIEQESDRVNNDNAEVTLKTTKKHREIAARVVAQGMKDEAQANARLIAAAPELLEALKEAQKLLHPLVMKMKVKDHFHEHNVLANTIVKAIAKAEGRDVA